MFKIVVINFKPLFGLARRKPFRVFHVCIDRIFSFTEKQNIRYDFGICRFLERRIRKSYRADKLRSVRDVLSDGRIEFIQSPFARDDRHKSVRLYLVDAFGDEIVVNQEMVFVIIRIEYAVTAERYVRYHKVKGIVLKTGFFKPLDLYSCLRIQFGSDSTRYAVKFHTVQMRAVRDFLRHKSEKITRSHCRL